MTSSIRTVLCLILIPAILACAAPAGVHPPLKEPPVRWEGRSAPTVLAELKREQARIRDLSALFSLSIKPPSRGRPSGMNGVILFSRREEYTRFRITALGPFGRTLFDMVHECDRITVYIPSKDTAYRGSPSEGLSFERRPEDIFSNLFLDLADARAEEDGTVVLDGGNLLLPLEDGTLVLDASGGVLREWRRADATILYESYVRPPGGPPVPTSILLEKKDGSLRVNCRLSDVSAVPPPAGAFELSLPDSTRLKPLEALER